ncbi:helix-turn-helix domain-containing protein [Nonomuraea dietziae]|uniref:helix-turn-helix domain-containing protein n=1 Tax=Nonomuraea dietziae TaxID=65515 RepID=UPI003CD0A217
MNVTLNARGDQELHCNELRVNAYCAAKVRRRAPRLPADGRRAPMPGDRLTDEDRQHIAAGLAEGLGYTEIGRRLGRARLDHHAGGHPQRRTRRLRGAAGAGGHQSACAPTQAGQASGAAGRRQQPWA